MGLVKIPLEINGAVRNTIKKSCTAFRGHLVNYLHAEMKSEFGIRPSNNQTRAIEKLKKHLPGGEHDFRYRDVRADGTKVGKLGRPILTTLFVHFFNQLEVREREAALLSIKSLPVEGYAFACTIVEHLLREYINSDGSGEVDRRDFKPSSKDVQDSYVKHVKFINKLQEKNPTWANRCTTELCEFIRKKCLHHRGEISEQDDDVESDDDMCINTDDE